MADPVQTFLWRDNTPAARPVGCYLTARPIAVVDGRWHYQLVTRTGDVLGQVEWYPDWRRYVLGRVIADAVWSDYCLQAVARLLGDLTNSHPVRPAGAGS